VILRTTQQVSPFSASSSRILSELLRWSWHVHAQPHSKPRLKRLIWSAILLGGSRRSRDQVFECFLKTFRSYTKNSITLQRRAPLRRLQLQRPVRSKAELAAAHRKILLEASGSSFSRRFVMVWGSLDRRPRGISPQSY
jgi:hypothetical protein